MEVLRAGMMGEHEAEHAGIPEQTCDEEEIESDLQRGMSNNSLQHEGGNEAAMRYTGRAWTCHFLPSAVHSLCPSVSVGSILPFLNLPGAPYLHPNYHFLSSSSTLQRSNITLVNTEALGNLNQASRWHNHSIPSLLLTHLQKSSSNYI